MVKYCSECRNEIEAGFKFCPECGKKLMVRPTSCPECGTKLKEKFKFCPECGKDILPSIQKSMPKPKKVERTEPNKKVEEIKPIEKTIPEKKVKSKFTKPKISFNFLCKIKRPGKKVLMIISVICIVLVVAAAIVLFNPFNTSSTNGGLSGGRTFIISIENTHDSTAECYVLIDGLRQGESGVDFEMSSGDTKDFSINEDALQYLRDSYDVKLFVSIDDEIQEDTALNVKEYATFLIFNPATDSYQFVNCTDFQ